MIGTYLEVSFGDWRLAVWKTAESNKENKVYDCPVEAALDVLGGKWGLPIVARLAAGTQR